MSNRRKDKPTLALYPSAQRVYSRMSIGTDHSIALLFKALRPNADDVPLRAQQQALGWIFYRINLGLKDGGHPYHIAPGKARHTYRLYNSPRP